MKSFENFDWKLLGSFENGIWKEKVLILERKCKAEGSPETVTETAPTMKTKGN